jgi:hypothetical protein
MFMFVDGIRFGEVYLLFLPWSDRELIKWLCLAPAVIAERK